MTKPTSTSSRPVAGTTSRAKRIRLPASERRQQFVAIAFDLIAEKGFEGLRFQDVAQRAGVNSATLLHQFASKEALIQAVVHLLVERMRTSRTPPSTAPKDAIAELRQEFDDLQQFLNEVPTFFIVLTEIALRARRDKSIANIVGSREQFWHQRLAGLLQRGISQGLFDSKVDSEAVIVSLMVQIKGIAHHASLSPGGGKLLPVVASEIAEQVLLRLTSYGRRKDKLNENSHTSARSSREAVVRANSRTKHSLK